MKNQRLVNHSRPVDRDRHIQRRLLIRSLKVVEGEEVPELKPGWVEGGMGTWDKHKGRPDAVEAKRTVGGRKRDR